MPRALRTASRPGSAAPSPRLRDDPGAEAVGAGARGAGAHGRGLRLTASMGGLTQAGQGARAGAPGLGISRDPGSG